MMKGLIYIIKRIFSAKDAEKIDQIPSPIDHLENLRSRQEEFLSLYDADRMTLYVVVTKYLDGTKRSKRELVSKIKTGDEIEEIRLPFNSDSIAGYCAVERNVVNVTNAYDDNELKRISPNLKFNRSVDEKTGYKTRQVLAAPIWHKHRDLGVIQLINKKKGTSFTEKDKHSLRDFGYSFGRCIKDNLGLFYEGELPRRPTRFDYLINKNIITDKDLEQAISSARKERKKVDSVLISDYQISKDDIGKSLATYYETRLIQYDEKMVIPGRLVEGLDPKFLKRNVFVPVSQSSNKVIVAMENPDYLPARDMLSRKIPGKEFEYCVALTDDILKMIDHAFSS
jgi:hypothetical protein